MSTPPVVVIVYVVCGDRFLPTRKIGARIADRRGTALANFLVAPPPPRRTDEPPPATARFMRSPRRAVAGGERVRPGPVAGATFPSLFQSRKRHRRTERLVRRTRQPSAHVGGGRGHHDVGGVVARRGKPCRAGAADVS